MVCTCIFIFTKNAGLSEYQTKAASAVIKEIRSVRKMHKVYPLGSSSYTQQYLHKRYTAYLHSTRNVLSCGFLRLLAACKSPGTFSLPLFYFESVSPQKKWLKKKKKKQKKTQVIYMSIQILSLWFFFFECYVNLRKFIPLFVFIWMEK